ncbi:MAG: 4Fe-4S dicluster-binding protein [bacterium]
MYPEPRVDLSVEFCGVRFAHPFILAASPSTDELDMVRDAFRAGWAGAVLKTTSVEGTPVDLVYPMMSGMDMGTERLVGMGNIDLISRYHIDEVEKRIAALKSEFPDKRVIASISGQSKESWQELARRSSAAGADLIECSFSCPQGTMGLRPGAMLGQDANASAQVAGWIKEAAGATPVVIKLTPQVADIAEVALAVKAAGADAVCVGNTVPALMGVDLIVFPLLCKEGQREVEHDLPLLTSPYKGEEPSTPSNSPLQRGRIHEWTPIPNIAGRSTYSGLSGPAIKPISLRCVAEVARRAAMPIAASGGAVTWRDSMEFILLGASVVEFCTAVMHFGFDMVTDLIEGLSFHLERCGIGSVREIMGRALAQIGTHEELVRGQEWRPLVDAEQCVRCGLCMIACRDAGHRAIVLDAERFPAIDDEKCVGCALCSCICPAYCIEMKKRHEA